MTAKPDRILQICQAAINELQAGGGPGALVTATTLRPGLSNTPIRLLYPIAGTSCWKAVIQRCIRFPHHATTYVLESEIHTTQTC